MMSDLKQGKNNYSFGNYHIFGMEFLCKITIIGEQPKKRIF